ARANGTQELRPVKQPKKSVPHHVHAAGVIVRRGEVLLAQKPSKGLLGGMWEFPNGRVQGDPAEELTQVLEAGYRLKVQKKEALGVVQHAYTHFKVTVHVFRCDLLEMADAPALQWVAIGKLGEYPMGKIDRWIANALLQQTAT
ncbi:MAG: NUDIX domain-containing protein, partial [Chloroflexota bacterium]